MMDIQILTKERMSESGSALIRLMQDKSLSKLDLLVRESIQNSLDAALNKSKKERVDVDFITGSFNKEELNSEFEILGSKLDHRYPSSEYKFIAVRDSRTYGLTGSNDPSDDKSRLQGLVYQISKRQEAAGAGGSWGLGKTTFFKIGIGLVIYYSRTLNENNQYESRLAATFVEDESIDMCLIKTDNSRGISFFGKHVCVDANNYSLTVPITDETYIDNFLKILNIKPYGDKETGTTVIMPYSDFSALLNDAKPTNDLSGDVRDPPGLTSVEDYIRLSIQRWYSPRLHNVDYDGAWLKASVNGVPITFDKMFPIFKVIRELYNSTYRGYKSIFLKDLDVNVKAIKCNSVQKQVAGYASAVYVDSDAVLRLKNEINRNAYAYVGQYDGVPGTPIVTFTRKPGMLIKYSVDDSAWSPKIPGLDENKVLLCVFRLDSERKINEKKLNDCSLEEYVRSRERADHHEWENNPQFNIINRIAKNTGQFLNENYGVKVKRILNKKSNLCECFAEFFLPNIANSTHNSISSTKSSGKQSEGSGKKGTKRLKKSKKIKFDILSTKIEGNSRYMEFSLIQPSSISIVNFEIVAFSEKGSINHSEWESEFSKNFPLNIVEFGIDGILKNDGNYTPCSDKTNLSRTTNYFRDYTISSYRSQKGSLCVVSVCTNKKGLSYRGHIIVSSYIETMSFSIIVSEGE